MTASAPITGTLRAISDAASAPPPDSGVPAHANFRSVLEQYHSARESASDADADHSAPQKKQKDSGTTSSTLPANPAGNPLVPQAVTAPAEPARLILPFTTSITLRQDTTAAPEDAATQDSTTATDPTPQSSGDTSGTATTLPTPVIFRSTFDLRSLPLVSDSKSLPIPAATQPKIQVKGQAKLSKESAPSPDAAAATPASSAPADPSTPLLPVATSSTLQPATTAAQTSSTVSEAPEPVPTPTPAPAFTVDRRSAYQFHSSPERPTETLTINRTTQEPQKASDPTPAAAAAANVTALIPVTNTVEPPPPVHLPAGAPAPRQNAPASQNNSSVVTQDSSATAATDPRTAMPPVIERAEDTTAAPTPQGSLAFAARLSPTEETPAPAPTTDANRTPDSQPRPQTMLQTPVAARPNISQADVQSDTHSGESASPSPDQEKMSERFAKLETLLPQTHAATADQPAAAPATHAPSTSPLTVAARMDQVPEIPPAPSSGNHDITIRIPDAATDQGTAVRFVERAGEVHVSVRTSDTEMAQTLRGGLNDLVNRLEDGGIRTQVWQPGADASTSQNNSQQPFADPDGSNGRQYSSGSNSEQESKQPNKPRWVEELEGSIGTQNSKETPQLWQA
ncbi:MAG TPA: hypothetical protein VLM42_18570 [Bryobacteraceae bacterium]|nr:hypothetical protein [Bryobacteraceae bacterium]